MSTRRDKDAASVAVLYWPPVFLAIHDRPASAWSAVTAKPTTWTVKSTPIFFKAVAIAQGSPPQLSKPSLTRMTVAWLFSQSSRESNQATHSDYNTRKCTHLSLLLSTDLLLSLRYQDASIAS